MAGVPTVGNGCYLHEDCFTCPFLDCVISSQRAAMNFQLKRKAIELFRSGVSVKVITKEVNRSARTVQRWLDVENLC